MSFGPLVLDDLDGLLRLVCLTVSNSSEMVDLVCAIEELQAGDAEWFRDEAMGFGPPLRPGFDRSVTPTSLEG